MYYYVKHLNKTLKGTKSKFYGSSNTEALCRILDKNNIRRNVHRNFGNASFYKYWCLCSAG